MALHMTKRRIVKFAQDHGFDRAKRVGTYNGCDVYSPFMNRKGDHIIGFPHFILVKGNEIIMHIDHNLELTDALYPPQEVDEEEEE